MVSPTVGSFFYQLRQSRQSFLDMPTSQLSLDSSQLGPFSWMILVCLKLAKLTTTGTFTVLWESGFLTELELHSRLGRLTSKLPRSACLHFPFHWYWDYRCELLGRLLFDMHLGKLHLSQPPSMSVGGKCCQDFSLDPQTPSRVRRKECPGMSPASALLLPGQPCWNHRHLFPSLENTGWEPWT